MQRRPRFALAVVDAALVLLVLLYGALILLVILRPWLDDIRGLLLGQSPADLVAFVAGILCIIGVPMLLFRRWLSGVMWFCAILAVEVSAALRQFSPRELHFDGTGRVWLYVILSFIALAIFVRFIYPGRSAAHTNGLTNR
jgi:hypothetical protein